MVASTAFAAGIVNPAAYTSLVLLAVTTSVLAGVVLSRVLRRGTAAGVLRGDGAPPDGEPRLAGGAPTS